MITKPLASGAYVLNKVSVKRRLGAAGGNQTDAAHLLNQSSATAEDSQVCLTKIMPVNLKI